MDMGIVGLPNVGKSTLFNAITAAGIPAENFPFCTIEPNVGVTTLPDPRLDRLAQLYKPEAVIPATVRFVDIAGLVKGAHEGQGLGNKFLAHIRECDAIAHVVRCFEDQDVIHVDGSIDPIRDIETIELELIFADLDTVKKRIVRTEKAAKSDAKLRPELEFLKRLETALDAGTPARLVPVPEDLPHVMKELSLLSSKPCIYVCNVPESEVVTGNAWVTEVGKRGETVMISARIESEVSQLDPSERGEFLASLGLEASGLDRLVRAAFHALGLATFLTAGEKEVRAWTYHRGMKAPQCAGVIHTDFERTFIRAEVCTFADLDRLGSMAAVREAGLLRLEGKEYEMKDGDVVYFRVGA